jgi:hypothetical protein
MNGIHALSKLPEIFRQSVDKMLDLPEATEWCPQERTCGANAGRPFVYGESPASAPTAAHYRGAKHLEVPCVALDTTRSYFFRVLRGNHEDGQA